MKIIRMKKSGRRLQVNNRKGALLLRMGVAVEEPPVVKQSLGPTGCPNGPLGKAGPVGLGPLHQTEEASVGIESEEPAPRPKRRYRRRDLEAEV